MRNSLMARLRAIETKSKGRPARHVYDMTDQEIWEALDIRRPETGELRTDLTDDELEEMLRRARAGIPLNASASSSNTAGAA